MEALQQCVTHRPCVVQTPALAMPAAWEAEQQAANGLGQPVLHQSIGCICQAAAPYDAVCLVWGSTATPAPPWAGDMDTSHTPTALLAHLHKCTPGAPAPCAFVPLPVLTTLCWPWVCHTLHLTTSAVALKNFLQPCSAHSVPGAVRETGQGSEGLAPEGEVQSVLGGI